MEAETKIMYASDEAAQYKTNIEGWVSSTGRFWGKDEHMARWEGSTHDLCACGNERERSYTICPACIAVAARERYEAMPFQEWDGKTPLVIYGDDTYFWDSDGVEEYCFENEIDAADLQLVICVPNYLDPICADRWQDIMPEDTDFHEEYPEVMKKIAEFNEFLATMPPVSWSAGKYRTKFES